MVYSFFKVIRHGRRPLYVTTILTAQFFGKIVHAIFFAKILDFFLVCSRDIALALALVLLHFGQEESLILSCCVLQTVTTYEQSSTIHILLLIMISLKINLINEAKSYSYNDVCLKPKVNTYYSISIFIFLKTTNSTKKYFVISLNLSGLNSP
jgi:hypothetical protein